MKRLPDAEYEVMDIVWNNPSPITTNTIMQQLTNQKGWKAQTLITLLNRLVKRGFLTTDKQGKERMYYPAVQREDYLHFETESFISRYFGNSFIGLVASLYDGKKLSDQDIQELKKLLKG